mgnify:CR=1 FL=1
MKGWNGKYLIKLIKGGNSVLNNLIVYSLSG